MKIISYNINGIRSGIKKGFLKWIHKSNPDIICLQEIRAELSQINISIFKKMGYQYNYWFSSKKKGYSGVCIFSKRKPFYVEYGIGIDSIDKEGRVLRIDLKNENISVINLYLPSGRNMKKRLKFKFFFMKEFSSYIKKIKKKIPNLIICGDYNICHKEIDIHDPIKNKEKSGFLPSERKWMDDFMELGFIDSFRKYTKSGNNYTWWSYYSNSKKNNKGWRIDYAMVSNSIKTKKSYLASNINYSDHCPVILEIEQ